MSKLIGRFISFILLAAIILTGWDFVQFADRAQSSIETKTDIAGYDAVVVLTGGRTRIAEGSKLAQGSKLPLFISGVYASATPQDVAQAAGIDPSFFKCCATLGYKAKSTHENGLEIANWSNNQGYTKLIVVTSNYHMERALLELERAMPNTHLKGYSVASPAIHADRWWRDAPSAKRMLVEWIKWRIIKTREKLVI